ncbi:hypothetical protein [Oceanobacillus jeddahense]|uniref:hypothetical protein n=1 Tax=Oceanobacillus jeddahense TaxID=1462527 RepID=UPI0006940F95|nr:hypothetical protein [Oceanobacillus jeddahense]
MGLIDVYLQKYDKTRQDVIEQSNMEKTQKLNLNQEAASYHAEIIKALSITVDQDTETVHQELQMLEKEKTPFKVYTQEELLTAFKRKEPYIIVKGDYARQVESAAGTSLSEKDTMGFQLGSRGLALLAGEVIYQIMNLFSKREKQELKVESKIKSYQAVLKENKDVLLYLRLLDY